ncbi:unnamed protein product [Closterium sp. NIES-54]
MDSVWTAPSWDSPLPQMAPSWTTTLLSGKVGDASAFRVWGSRAFVRDLSADKLSPRAVPCVFLGFPLDAPGWQFYHPTSRRVLSSQDVTFDESVPYYPYRTASLPPPPLFLAPGPPPVDPLPPQGSAPSGVSQVDAVEPVEVAVDSGAATGAEPAGAGSGGAGSGGAGLRVLSLGPGGAEPGVTEPGGAEPGGAGSTRVASRGASLRREVLSPQELREWFARHWSRAAGAGGTTATTCPGGAGAAGPGGPAKAAGVGPTGGSAGASGGTGAAGSTGSGAAGATGVGAAGGVGAGGSADAGTSEGAGAGATGAGGTTGAGAPAGSPGAVPAGSSGALRPRPYFVPLLEQVLGLLPSPGPAPPFECPPPIQSQSLLPPVSPLPAPSPYTGPTGGLAERRAPASRPASPARPACTSRRTSRPRPPAVPGTHQMALRPSTAPLRVPLPSPPASSLPAFPDPESDSLRAASPTVARFLATVVIDPSLASTAASALVAELVDFAASYRLDYAASLVAESASVCPPSVGGECALSTDVLEDRQQEFQCFAAALPHLVSTLLAPEGDPDAPDIPTPRSYAKAIEGPYSSQWQAAMDAEMASWKSTGTYVDEVPPPGANICFSGVLDSCSRSGFPVKFLHSFTPVHPCSGSSHAFAEHRTKHIALRYFLARELQQHGQLRLAYVASEANTADIFTKALAPGDHQRFRTLLGFPTSNPHSRCLAPPCLSPSAALLSLVSLSRAPSLLASCPMALRPLAAFARDWLKRAPALALLAAALLALALRFGLSNSSGCDPCGGDSEGDEGASPEPLAHFTDSRTGSQGATSDAAALVASWLTPGSDGEGAPARTRFHISNYGFPGPVPWRFVRQRVREQFTLGGRIALVCWWHSKSKPGSVAKSFVWSTDDIDARAAQARARDPALGSYGPNVTAAFLQAFERYPVSGKSVLVIGSRSPWVESICLGFDAEAITTVDFNKPIASHPKMRQMLVEELEGTDEVFDVAVSFSSLEHDGLGRYGDPINPFGDLQRMHKIKGLIKPGGLLFLGVPVGNDTLVYNSHRIYGPIRMPLLLTGWKLLDVFGASSLEQLYRDHEGSSFTQPLMVLTADH